MSRLERGDLPPEIVTVPPGPRSRELSAALAASEAPGSNTLGADDAPAVVWSEALGANVLDVDGNRYVDLTAGFGVAAVGHRHPAVVRAVGEQSARLLHGLGDVAAHPTRVELAVRLAALAPVDRPRIHFAVSGADAVEIALKTAIASTGRLRVLAFDPAYHGTTLGALAATSRAEFREPFAGHLHPHVERLGFGAPLATVAETLARAQFAAVLVEPVVGREGVRVPPPGWLAGVAGLTRAHGALFVADEIFTGFGRTGRMFAVDRDRVRPDLLCCGKALGGGLPIAAVVGSRERLEVWRGSGEALHTATFVAHPLACAAALAALDVLEAERLVERSARLGAWLGEGLERIAGRSPAIAEHRGLGLLHALEFVDAARARRFGRLACERGLLLLVGGADGRVAEIAPPLVVSVAQLETALDLLSAVALELDAEGAA